VGTRPISLKSEEEFWFKEVNAGENGNRVDIIAGEVGGRVEDMAGEGGGRVDEDMAGKFGDKMEFVEGDFGAKVNKFSIFFDCNASLLFSFSSSVDIIKLLLIPTFSVSFIFSFFFCCSLRFLK
jgi:hypothetical protein